MVTAALGSPVDPEIAARDSSGLSVRDILVSVYGPVETWHPVRAIDVDPHGTFDGHPVNESLIVAYEPPRHASQAKRDLAGRLLAERQTQTPKDGKCGGLSTNCYRWGSWVEQYQLYNAKDTFCSDAASRAWWEPDSDTQVSTLTYWQDKKLYQARDGSWKNFNNHLGQTVGVFFYKQWIAGFDLSECQQHMEGLVTRCRGSQPDSAGGCYAPSAGGWQIIDPADP